MLIYDKERHQVDYKRQHTILICVSGETRTYNHHEGKHLKFFVSKLESLGYKVYLVGHTWAHCDVPNLSYVENFLEVKIEDQSVIDDWILEDIAHRIPKTPPKIHDRYRKPVRDYEAYIQDTVAQGRPIYGQIWSAFGAFNLVNTCWRDIKPDIFIRWRWDGTIIEDHNNIPNIHITEDVKNYIWGTLDITLRQIGQTTSRPVTVTTANSCLYSSGIESCNTLVFTGVFEDVIMAYNARAMLKLMNPLALKNTLNLMLSNSRNAMYSRSAHTLWYTVLNMVEDNMGYAFHLPEIFYLERSKIR